MNKIFILKLLILYILVNSQLCFGSKEWISVSKGQAGQTIKNFMLVSDSTSFKYAKTLNFKGYDEFRINSIKVNKTFDTILCDLYIPFISSGKYSIEVDNGCIPNNIFFEIVPPPIRTEGFHIAVVGGKSVRKIIGENTSFMNALKSLKVWYEKDSTKLLPDSINVINDTTIMAYFTNPKTIPHGYYNLNVYDSLDGLLVNYINESISGKIKDYFPKIVYNYSNVTFTINAVSGSYYNVKKNDLSITLWDCTKPNDLSPDSIIIVNDSTLSFSLPINCILGKHRFSTSLKTDFFGLWDMDSLTIIASGDLSSSHTVKDPFMNVYPNPYTNDFSIEIYGLSSKNIKIDLCKIDGEFIDEVYNGKPNEKKINYCNKNLPIGIYILRFISDEGIILRKLVKI